MKLAFVLQYYPYQYEQFKPLIDYLNADAYYRIHTNNPSQYKNATIKTINSKHLPEGTECHYESFTSNYYDAVVYTGTWCESLLKFADRCKYKNIICMSHSLIGSLYDISIVTPTSTRSVGVVPWCWTSFDSFRKRMRIISDESLKTHYVMTKSHPIVCQAISEKPRVKVEDGVLGVILGHKSPFKHFSQIVEDLVKIYGFNKVKVKLHPLTVPDDALKYFNQDYLEILPQEYDKYDWLDSCEYVIGGCSSLLIEEIVRSNYFKLCQKFKQFPFKRRGIPLDIASYNDEGWSTSSKQFEDFSMYSIDRICEAQKTVIKSIIGGQS